ncbi:transcriptional regulator [Phytoactinopolyspora alkaliphila]|uniref:Transcriptional regulator n=1 Tax=Phytoactinopolyspora alkaliphila TaxID=1783498 RepID=A0A6N9YLF5_9ACTN|nr:transcriptional regulator [Phytoactinopolyspora alkaliphila]NED95709.1 transcriptional regulator [Phytoactinopolyspora alkaliphila]
MHRAEQGTREEITIGVLGTDDAVRRIVAVARETGGPWWRLVTVSNTPDSEARVQAAKMAPRVDVCLFSGPMSFDAAAAQGELPVPATYVPLDGSALHGTLLRGILADTFDPLRISVDSVSEADVGSAYEEIGLSAQAVRVQPYARSVTAAEFAAFHRDQYDAGHTSGGITTVPAVALALTEAGVPMLVMPPSRTAVRHALHTAVLIGSGAKLEESRIVTVVVRVHTDAIPPHASPSSYWYQDLKLALYRELLREARPMDAAVLPRDERSYLVVTTMGSLRMATGELTVAPFLRRVTAELGIALEVGIGLGRSTREAELNAQTAVDRSAAESSGGAYVVGPGETVLRLPAEQDQGSARIPAVRDPKAADTLARLASQLGDDADLVVDAEKVAGLLGVTMQTARRTLKTLVDEGLAWPMPPARSSKVGRPPSVYQLLVEKITP